MLMKTYEEDEYLHLNWNAHGTGGGLACIVINSQPNVKLMHEVNDGATGDTGNIDFYL